MIHTPNNRLLDSKRLPSSFSVKRKKINFNLLDTQHIQRQSSASSFHPTTTILPPPPPECHPVVDLIKEKDEKIQELKKKLDQVKHELHTSRHEYQLMKNERKEFEANMMEACAKEKQQVELELKILKETHIEKVQSLSSSLNQLFNTVNSLRDVLKRNNIQEETVDIDSLMISDSNHYKQDAQFIQDAYYKVKGETHINHPLWSNIRSTTCGIKYEIDHFEAWKSIPVADLTKLLREDHQKNNSMKSLLFGKKKKI